MDNPSRQLSCNLGGNPRIRNIESFVPFHFSDVVFRKNILYFIDITSSDNISFLLHVVLPYSLLLFLLHQLQPATGTMIRRRTTNRWRQQAPLIYYWNRRREQEKEDDENSSSSEQDDDSLPSHISPPTVIYITNPTAMTTKPQQSSSGRKAGALNYGFEETKHLFDIMERILPIGTDEWKAVLDEHSVKFPGRTVLSIRRRYQTLHRKQAPTGSPNMPEDVRQAKRIKHNIGKRAELCDGTEEFNLEEGFKNTVESVNDDAGAPGIQSNETTQTTQPTVDSTSAVVAPTNPSEDSTITPTKRSYNSKFSSPPFPGGDRFLQTYQMSLQQERLYQEREARRWERERLERQSARDDMMKMIGVAVSQFATAIAGGNNNVSAVFSPRQAPRFEGLNGEPIVLPDNDDEDDDEYAQPPPASKKRVGDNSSSTD